MCGRIKEKRTGGRIVENGYDERLLGAGTEEESEVQGNTAESDEYYDLPLAIKSRSLIWAVISLAAGVLSILLCPFYFVSLVFSAGAAVFSLVSRKNLGFFEKYSIMGLVLGMMGFVFSVFSFIASIIGLI